MITQNHWYVFKDIKPSQCDEYLVSFRTSINGITQAVVCWDDVRREFFQDEPYYVYPNNDISYWAHLSMLPKLEDDEDEEETHSTLIQIVDEMAKDITKIKKKLKIK